MYVACAIDTEGLITFKSRGGGEEFFDQFIVITNTNVQWLEYLQTLIGGKIHTQGKPKKIHHKQGYRLALKAASVRAVLPCLLPYLIIKQQQAKLCLEYEPSKMGAYGGRGWARGKMPDDVREKKLAMKRKMKELNAKGVPLGTNLVRLSATGID